MNNREEQKSTDIKLSLSDEFSSFLRKNNLSLIMTTNPGAVITLGVTEHGLKLCHKPVMGAFAIACSHEKISISHMRGITVFKKVGFTPLLDPNSNTDYSDYYTPLLTFHTGTCMVHELHAVPSGLLSVNTNFSTIDLIDGQYNFSPIWKPSFISKIIPEDRCHLNGMAVKDKKIKFVSCYCKLTSTVIVALTARRISVFSWWVISPELVTTRNMACLY